VLFERVISNAGWTLPALVGILSGRYPTAKVFEGRLRTSLVEPLRHAGWRTAAFTEGGFASRHFGFDRGFDSWWEQEGAVNLFLGGQRRADLGGGGVENTFGAVKSWLRENGQQRFFLLVHTYEVHTPYRRQTFTKGLDRGVLNATFEIADGERTATGEISLGETELQYVRALYDGGVLAADQQVGALMRSLEDLGLDGRTLLVVTSDHGEDLGDRLPLRPGNHGHTLYEELVRIPLVLYDPRFEFPVERISHQVRSIDIMPTILDLVGVPTAPGIRGRSLVPLMKGEEAEHRMAYMENPDRRDGTALRTVALIGYPHKLILNVFPFVTDRPLELYDLASDPEEAADLAATEGPLLDRLRAELNQLRAELEMAGRADFRVPLEAPEEVRERLRALGYVD
jgi:arylsulfatase A-like enzyme